MNEIAYETLPIGQPGRFVMQERQRLAVEMAALRADAERAGKLDAENRLLKQMLVIAWRYMQDESAEDKNRMDMKAGWAATIARHLEDLGVPVDCNAVTLERKG